MVLEFKKFRLINNKNCEGSWEIVQQLSLLCTWLNWPPGTPYGILSTAEQFLSIYRSIYWELLCVDPKYKMLNPLFVW